MSRLSALLYAALLVCANTAAADTAAVEALRDGDMKKLMFHSAPEVAGEAVVTDPEGGEHSLADYRGKIVVLNFWATWCNPCRVEMPTLSALEAALGGEDFAVVPVATGRNKVAAIRRFFGEIEVDNLPILLDPKKKLSGEMGVMGLPVTVILDREGNELARLMGDADWNSESARAILTALIEG